jgi:hypothetical protein
LSRLVSRSPAAAVAEHDRGAVRLDEVDDPLLDGRPDRARSARAGRRPAADRAGRLAERGHVLDRDDDLHLDRLGRRRLDDDHLAGAAEEAGDLVDRATVADRPIRCAGRLEQLVEPLQRQRQVRAALGAGHGVHLVDDHRLDAAQRLAGAEVSTRNSDSGVVMKTSGGTLLKRRRSSAGVSPDRMPTAMSGPAGRAAATPAGCRSAARAGCARRRRPAP